MNPITIIGLIAGFLTTVSALPQVIKTTKLKETEDISLGMYILVVVGILFWFIYGIGIRDLPLIAANALSLVLNSIVLIMKIKYG